jgi:hypothetical protein
MAALLEQICSDICELAGDITRTEGRIVIDQFDINIALLEDHELTTPAICGSISAISLRNETAIVKFRNTSEASRAYTMYNKVPLDGYPMSITII